MKRAHVTFLVLITLIAVFYSIMSTVQAELNPLWAMNYGGDRDEVMYKAREMPDGGFLTVGYKYASSGYGRNIYIVRTDYEGKEIWVKEFGAKDHDYGYDIVRARDGNFIIVGSIRTTTSFDQDIYLIKLNDNGDVIWDKEVHASGFDMGYSAVRTPPGDLYIAGSTAITAFHKEDVSLTKTDPDGNLVWRKIYGGYLEDEAKSIVATPDGGFLLAGRTQSYGNGGDDVYLIKTDNEGNMQWNRTYGGAGEDYADEVIITNDGNYLLVGSTDSFGNGESDVLALKVNFEGDVLWQRTYGGASDDFGSSVVEDKDGNLVITGTTFSYGAGSSDALVVKTDPNGKQLILETIGGEHRDTSQCIITSFGTYYVLGGSTSIKGLNDDFYLVKFSLIQNTLNVSTPVGAGTYYKGANVKIGVQNDIVYVDNYTRYVFNGWLSDSEYGYNGKDSVANISLIESVVENATWRKQYYVKVDSEGSGNVTGSGWFDEGSNIKVKSLPGNGSFLSKWIGVGNSSYTGTQQNMTITVNSPITQTAMFVKGEPCSVDVTTKYGEVSVPALVVNGSEVTFDVTPSIVETGDGVRYVFNGWRGDGINSQKNPMLLTITGDTKLTVSWRRQFLLTDETGLGLSGWYDEGTAITLESKVEGIIPKQVYTYSVNREPLEGNTLIVLGASTVSGSWKIDYLSLAPVVAAIIIVIAACAVIYLKKLRGKPDSATDDDVMKVEKGPSVQVFKFKTSINFYSL
jgi:hypothetical protein